MINEITEFETRLASLQQAMREAAAMACGQAMGLGTNAKSAELEESAITIASNISNLDEIVKELSLMKSTEVRYRKMYETSSDAIITLGPPTWVFDSGNPAAIKMFTAKGEKQLTSLSPSQLSPEFQPNGENSTELAQQHIEKALAEGSNYFEWSHRRLNGDVFPATVLLTMFDCGDGPRLQATVREITAQKLVEDNLKRLSAATEQTHDSVAITDARGVIQYVNAAFQEVTGYSSGEAIGSPMSILNSGKHDKSFYVDLWQTIKGGKRWAGRFYNRRKDGSTLIEESTISPIRNDSGEIVSFVTVQKDVTKILELETANLQSQKLESIGQLASGIAHEINTPAQFVGDNLSFIKDSFSDIYDVLNSVIKLGVSLKEKAQTDPEITSLLDCAGNADLEYVMSEIPDAIEQSLEGVERISVIVKAMKEFSHPGSEDKAASNLNDAITATATVARNRWRYVAELELNLGEGLENVPCYLNDFNQVILNMVVNAADAITEKQEAEGSAGKEKGLIVVTTKIEDSMAVIEVSDNANGMNKTVLSKIFDPFFTTKEIGKGTGQGLSIAYSTIVDKHAGTMSCQSVPNKGTKFRICLPLTKECKNDAE